MRDRAAALHAVPPEAWHATVPTARGRAVPATEIPWRRTREVCVHAVDVGAGVTSGDLPARCWLRARRELTRAG